MIIRPFTLGLRVLASIALGLPLPPLSAAEVEVELVHELGPDKGEQLAKLVERFNAGSKLGRIKMSERSWSEGKPPALMILEAESEAQLLARRNSTKPLFEVMKVADEPVRALPPPRMMVPSFLDSKGRPLALPVGLGTPVMYAHKPALVRAGIDPDKLPTTWQDWQETLGKLRQFGFTCPYTTAEPVSVFIENTSAWNNQPYASSGKKEEVIANGLMQVKHIALMNSWVRGRYLHLFGAGHEAEKAFIDNRCVTLTASSALWPTLRRKELDVVVAPLPYHDGAYGAPQNTLADGPAMWVGAGYSKDEYKLIGHFVSFWLTPESQVEWQVNAGYLPLNQAGLLVATGSKLLEESMLANRIGIEELTRKPVNSASAASALSHKPGVRRIFAEELDEVWADRKPPKQALDDAVIRIRQIK